MDSAEQALLLALEASPGDWSIRLLVAEKMRERGGTEECAELIAAAPGPPSAGEHLQKAVELGGSRALPIAQGYVAVNPADGFAHHLLGFLLQNSGDPEQAAKHFEAARALGYSTGEEVTPPPPPAQDGGDEYGDPYGYPSATPPPPTGIGQEIPAGPAYLEPERPQTKKVGSKLTAVSVAILVHVLLAIIGAILVILPPKRDDPEIVAAVIGPPAAKQEMQKKNVVKQVKKSTSAAAAAAPVAQLMRANAMAKFSLPKVTTTSTGPLGMGEGNLGAGGFGGTGSGLGSGASFFGGSATGQRFLFVLDHSASMKNNQIALRNKELEKALKALKGVQYHVLLFAGAGFYAEKGWSIKGMEVVTDPKGTSYRFRKKKVTDFEFVGADSRLPKAEWLETTPTQIKATMDFIRKTPKFGGTDWEMALRIAHYMDPKPDVIFFMADGTGGNDPKPILSVNKRRGSPVINTIAMQTSNGAAQFGAVARGTKGKFTIVDKRGKPIDGFEYLKNPGKFKGRL